MMPYLPREQIEAGVVDKLKSHVPARENLEQLAKMLAEAMDSASIQWREYLDPLDRKLNEVGKRLGRLYEALETGKLGLDDLAQRTHDLKQRQDKFQTGRDEVAGRVRGRKKELVDLATVEAYAEDLQTVLSEGNLTERKTFIK
jgi:DNA repair ATPase RecN